VRRRTEEGASGIHAIGWANKVRYDPDLATNNRWWEFNETSELVGYRAFKPREVKK
jgi:hypothetical protein